MIESVLISIVTVGSFVGYLYFKDKYLENSKTPFHERLKIG